MTAGSENIVAAAVEETRQWALLMRLAEIGGTSNGGVDRQALTPGDTQAKNFVIAWGRARSFDAYQDEAANLFIRMSGREPALPPVLVGSHLDTQPTGGRFDGAFGVVAGLETLEAIRETGLLPRRSIEVVSWTNEEGSRFSPGASGSSAFAGTRPMETWLGATTTDSAAVAENLDRSIAETAALRRPARTVRPHAYLEAHIEQGPILQSEGLPACIVDAVHGQRRFLVEVRGRTAHAGTAPIRSRQDALVVATRLMSALHALADGGDDALRLTVGRIEAFPNSPNTVPDLVRFTIDLRHPESSVLDAVTNDIADVVDAGCAPCTATLERLSAVPPTAFAPAVLAILEEAALAAGLPPRRLSSGAGHDAMHLARICPSGMVFARCRDGISHHPNEYASPGDLATATRILAAATWRLAEQA